MGRKISFSIARLDKVAFITSPCLWPKVLRALIFSLEMFSSWSSLPHHHPSKKEREGGGGEERKGKTTSQWEHGLRASSETPSLPGSRVQFPCAAEDGLLGQRCTFLAVSATPPASELYSWHKWDRSLRMPASEGSRYLWQIPLPRLLGTAAECCWASSPLPQVTSLSWNL